MTETVVQETEHERVTRYRLDRLTRGGYDMEAAVLIAARHDIDLHKAEELIKQGCSSDIASRILL